jgi:hypothetical protein
MNIPSVEAHSLPRDDMCWLSDVCITKAIIFYCKEVPVDSVTNTMT